MVYAVFELDGRDDVTVWRNEEEANAALDQMYIINKNGKQLGYMIDTGEMYLANIYPKVAGGDQYIIKADLFPRIMRAVEKYKQKYPNG